MANLSGFVKRLRDIMRNDAGINGDAQRIEQIAWMLFLKVYDAKEQDWKWDDDGYVSIIPEECRWANWAHDDKSGKALTGESLLDFVNNTLFPTLKKLPVDASTPIKKAIVQSTFADTNNYMKDGVLLRQVINVIDELDLSDYEESHAFGEIYETILKELQSAGSAGEFYTPRAVTDFMAKMIKPQIGEQMADFACGTGGFITSWLKELEKEIKTTDDQIAYQNSIYGIEKKQFPYMLCITNMLLHGLDIPKVYHDNSLLKDVLDYTKDDAFNVVLMNPPYGGSEKNEVKNHFPADLASSETADLFMSVIMYRMKENGRAAVILPDGFLYGIDNIKVAIKKKLLSEFNLHTIIRMPQSVFSPYTSIATNILFFDKTGATEGTWFYRLDMPSDRKHFSKTKPMELKHFEPAVSWWNDRKEIPDPKNADNLDAKRTYKAKYYTIKEIKGNNYNIDLCGYPMENKNIISPEDTLYQYVVKREKLEKALTDATNTLNAFLSGNIDIELKNIKSLTHSLIDLDDAFPEDMKASLLQAAMQGKLTDQKVEDGDVEDLITQLSESKKELILKKVVKKDKANNPITTDEPPFDIPETWRWVRLRDLVNAYGGLAYDKSNLSVKTDDMITVFRGGNIKDLRYTFNSDDVVIARQFITKDGLYLRKNQLITPAVTSQQHLGKVARIDKDYNDVVAGGFVLNLVPYIDNDEFSKFLAYAFSMPAMKQRCKDIANKSGQAFYNLSREKLLDSVIPIPPLAEQKRIVEKLDKLLPLCEELTEEKPVEVVI